MFRIELPQQKAARELIQNWLKKRGWQIVAVQGYGHFFKKGEMPEAIEMEDALLDEIKEDYSQ